MSLDTPLGALAQPSTAAERGMHSAGEQLQQGSGRERATQG